MRTGIFAVTRWWGLAVYGKASGIPVKLSKTMRFNAIGLDDSNEEAGLLLVPSRCPIKHWRCFSDFWSMEPLKNFYH
jgi:hypothetical protein